MSEQVQESVETSETQDSAPAELPADHPLVKTLAEQKKTHVVPGEGKTPSSTSDPKRGFLRSLAGSD